MLRRKSFITLVLVTLMTALWIIPAKAAGSPWTVWLYENGTGRMTQVDSNGTTIRQFQLPADAGSHYSQNVAISADGLLAGYAAGNDTATYVSIYDLNTNSIIYSYSLPANAITSLDFSGSAFNFSDDNSTFAFGFANESFGWQIIVIDIITFSDFSLKETDVPLAALPASNGFMLPAITYNRNQYVKFAMVPLGADGISMFDAFSWRMGETAIAREDSYIQLDSDTLPLTSDVIMTLSDPRFPDNIDPIVGYPSTNTLQVYTPATNERFVVTSLPRIYNPRFIQGGERIAVTRYDNTADGNQVSSLMVLERSGALSGMVNGAPTQNLTSSIGTLNGFLFTSGTGGDAGGTTLYYVETRLAGAPYNAISVWNSTLGANASLAWSSDSNPAGVSPFAAWGRLSHSSVPAPTAVPAVPPTSSALIIGGQAQVQTTDGDVLNLRSGPARSFARLGTIGNGTLVTILEGPRNSDGLTWWRIRLPTGGEGWVVDSADGVQTLLPR